MWHPCMVRWSVDNLADKDGDPSNYVYAYVVAFISWLFSK